MKTFASEPEGDVLAGLRYHVIVCAESAKADLFVAELSRRTDWPEGFSPRPTSGPMEVWSTTPNDDGSVALFLNETALRAAEAAFSLVPVVGTISVDVRPRDAYLVLDGKEAAVDERRGFPGVNPGRRPAQSEWSAIRFPSLSSASARMP